MSELVRLTAANLLAEEEQAEDEPSGVAFRLQNVSVSYGDAPAVRDITLDVNQNRITAIIGPSGCGKSTLLRCLNRMNDLIPVARVEGQVFYEGEDIYAPGIDPVDVRRRIGMVFQKPNPFPKSIYDNVAFGPRVNGMRGNMDEIVEHSLRQAALSRPSNAAAARTQASSTASVSRVSR